MGLLRGVFLFSISALLSYWILLYEPGQPILPQEQKSKPQPIAVAPEVRKRVEDAAFLASLGKPDVEPTQEQEPEPEPPPPQREPEPEFDTDDDDAPPHEKPAEKEIPAPPEQGDVDGEKQAEKKGPTEDELATEVRKDIESLKGSKKLLDAAKKELAGKSRKGFQMYFLSDDEEQLDLARFFGESILLIPRRPTHYFKLELGHPAKVVKIDGVPPPIYRHRTFFEYKYNELPAPIRELRRQIPYRGDILMWGAAIPPSEYAIAIARRTAALTEYNRQNGANRTLEQVRRVDVRYVPLAGGGFDMRIKQFVFADGTRWAPTEKP